ncbi:hypothetical protein EJB05_14651 [Eragrostis curvula]|uniref:Uncharacterized protein n=1 Tax=Eragrostis curvula TaxID=38414 RepID=A0A5J9VZP0_9POAL|nr:hypothetical protein EJB05_14651 [Eragrostis curvula]
MALRFLARKLRIPATAALQTASSPRVSSAKSTLASLSSQTCEGNRAVNGAKKAQLTLKDFGKRNKEMAREYKRVAGFIDYLPKKIALSAAGGVFTGMSSFAYAFGAFDGSRKN